VRPETHLGEWKQGSANQHADGGAAARRLKRSRQAGHCFAEGSAAPAAEAQRRDAPLRRGTGHGCFRRRTCLLHVRASGRSLLLSQSGPGRELGETSAERRRSHLRRCDRLGCRQRGTVSMVSDEPRSSATNRRLSSLRGRNAVAIAA